MENGILIGKSGERNLPDMLLKLITEKEMLTILTKMFFPCIYVLKLAPITKCIRKEVVRKFL